MSLTKQTALARGAPREPFALLREMTSDFDRMFAEPSWLSFGWPRPSAPRAPDVGTWFPEIDVFEKDNRLVTRVDLPGMKKEDVKVEVTDGRLVISGERKTEVEEKKEHYYKCEREFGSFCRTLPLPAGAKLEDVKATFADGLLEVSVPLPARPEAATRKVEIQQPVAAAKPAA